MRYILFMIALISLLGHEDARASHKQGDTVCFANRKLRQLAEQMRGVEWLGRDTIMRYELLPENKSLVLRYNEERKLEHMGVSLFSQETKAMLNESVCDFLERLFLELVLQKTNEDVRRKLTEYHVRLRYEGFEVGENVFSSMNKMLSELVMPVNFTIRYEDKHGIASWNLEKEKHLSVLFPMVRELIDGMDKSESDTYLYDRLSKANDRPGLYQDEFMEEEELEKLGGNLYRRVGSYFLIPSLTSDVYYTKEAGKFVPLFSLDMPDKSLSSLFHTHRNGEGKILLITHRQYGHFTPEIDIRVDDFINLFADDFDVFSATNRNRKGEWETVVVIHHRVLNYIHLLRTRIDDEGLKSSPMLLKADFYSNIPQQYIKSLFNIKVR